MSWSWIERWLDTAIAPALQVILAALTQSGARAVNFYLGGRFSAGRGWTPQLSAELAQARPDVGQFGTWVALEPGQGGYALGHQDGLDSVAAAKAYPAIRWLSYDVEPSTWQAWPQGVDDAMRGFADAVHSAGYHDLQYGTPATVAGASGEDDIWIANPNPGGSDPASQPLDPSYYAGKRAVQFGSGTFGGVVWDVTHSEFSIGGDMAWSTTASDGDLVALHHIIQLQLFGVVDPSGQQSFVDAVRGGVSVNSVYDGWNGTPQSQAYQAALRSLITDEAAVAQLQAQVAHLQPSNAPGVDPAKLQAALAKLAADQQAVLGALQQEQADTAAAAADPAL